MTETTSNDTTKDPAAKRAAIKLLTKGLASRSEVARLARVSRQLVRHWSTGIDIDAARNSWLDNLWKKHLK